jgi:hypothetical protein
MPPWKPIPGHGDFKDANYLSDAERRRMATGGRRVEAGMIAAQAQKGLAEEPCAQNEYQCKRELRGNEDTAWECVGTLLDSLRRCYSVYYCEIPEVDATGLPGNTRT